MHCQWQRKPPKIAPSAWDSVTPLEEDRTTAIGNMHKNDKDRVCASGDRQTHIRAHYNTSSPLVVPNSPDRHVYKPHIPEVFFS